MLFMSTYSNLSWAFIFPNLEESKIFSIDILFDYSKFYYETTYYFAFIVKGPAAHNTQKWLATLHSI